MYHIIKQTNLPVLEENSSTRVPDCLMDGGKGRWGGCDCLFLFSPYHLIPPNDVCSNPAGPVLGLDQRIQ